jgi:thymidine phosphorylase
MGMKRLRETGGTCDVVESCTGTTLSERSAVAIQEECRGLGRGEASERRSTI